MIRRNPTFVCFNINNGFVMENQNKYVFMVQDHKSELTGRQDLLTTELTPTVMGIPVETFNFIFL